MAKIDKMVGDLTQASDKVDAKLETIESQKKEIANLQTSITAKEAQIISDWAEISALQNII